MLDWECSMEQFSVVEKAIEMYKRGAEYE